MHLITTPSFYAIAIPAVLLTGLSKAGFGGALGGFAVPLLALVLSPGDAAGIMLPLLCLTDITGLRPYWRKWHAQVWQVLIPSGLAGVALGAVLYPWLSEAWMRLLIGLISVLFVAHGWWTASRAGSSAAAAAGAAAPRTVTGTAAAMAAATGTDAGTGTGRRTGADATGGSGILFGTLGGFTSFLAHAGGPPLLMHLLPQKLDRVCFVATMNAYFLVINLTKLVPYALEGQLSYRNLGTSLLLAPLVPVGVWLGLWLQRRVNERWFYRLARTALLLTGLQLIVQAAPGLAADAPDQPLRIGSKRFTESYLLGEVLRQQAQLAGPAEHRAGLGNTGIVLAALRSGAIDLYPEYTGTIAREILHRPDLSRLPELLGPLQALGLGVAVPLGFSDTYVVAVGRDFAVRNHLQTLADLRQTPTIRLALSQEFLHRSDGWPALTTAYGLQALQPQGMDHGLAYAALAQGATDGIDAYSTDARLARDPILLLQDPQGVIPPYEAVLLYRLGVPEQHPAQWRQLLQLQGQISARTMQDANARVDLDHQDFQTAGQTLWQSLAVHRQRPATATAAPTATAAAPAATAAKAAAAPTATTADAAALVGDQPPTRTLLARSLQALFAPDFVTLTGQHLALVFGPVALATLLGIPLGILASRPSRLGGVLLGLVAVLQTIPALALLALLIAWTGQIGMLPALIALLVYALLPILSATQAALQGLDRNLREAAIALGASWGVRLWHVELPAVRPALLAGIRTATIINIGGATLAAFVGAGGYGERIVSGLAVNDPALLLAGAVPTAALALLAQGLFTWLEHRLR